MSCRFSQLLALLCISLISSTVSQNYCQLNHWQTGFHPHPDVCDRYIECNNFQTSILGCPVGTLYDAVVQACKSSSNVEKCNDAVTTATVPPDQDYCRKFNWATGKHPHPVTCDRYVECSNFITTIVPCDPGRLFDPGHGVCVEALHAPPCNDNNATSHVTIAPQCGPVNQGDILFILDSSSSIGYHDYEIQLNFAANITDYFDIAPNLTQFSVIVFSIRAESLISFNTTYDKSVLQAKIRELPYVGSTTSLDLALDLARNYSFTTSNGARPGKPKVAVVMTDGLSNDYAKTKLAAERLKNDNIIVISIGIGTFSQHELLDISSGPENVHQVDMYALLPSLRKDISVQICNNGVAYLCKHPLDVVFLLDSSSSIGYDNYKEQLRFVTEITKRFGLGRDDVQFGVVIFGSTAQILFHINQYVAWNQLEAALANAPYLSSSTNTAEALRIVTDSYMFEAQHGGGRNNSRKIVIVLTDGQSDNPTLTRQNAEYLKSRGVLMISVGVGRSLDLNELITLASDRTHAFCSESYELLDNSLRELIGDRMCQGTGNSQVGVIGHPFTGDDWDLCFEQNWANGIHPHPRDCTKFIECTFLRTSIMYCPVGLVFDPLKLTCLYPRDALSCKDFNDYKPIIGKRELVTPDTCSYLQGGGVVVNTNPVYYPYTTPYYIPVGNPHYDLSNICAHYNLPNGIYPDPGSCEHFVLCQSGISSHMACPSGTRFNSRTAVCEDVHGIDCNENYNYYLHFGK